MDNEKWHPFWQPSKLQDSSVLYRWDTITFLNPTLSTKKKPSLLPAQCFVYSHVMGDNFLSCFSPTILADVVNDCVTEKSKKNTVGKEICGSKFSQFCDSMHYTNISSFSSRFLFLRLEETVKISLLSNSPTCASKRQLKVDDEMGGA